MKSKTITIATIISVVVLFVVLAAGLVVRITGPIQIGSSLRVTSDWHYGHWLVFFEGDEFPHFNGLMAIGDENGLVLATGSRVKRYQETVWHLWGDMGFYQGRYVDATGMTQLFTTDFRLPGVF